MNVISTVNGELFAMIRERELLSLIALTEYAPTYGSETFSDPPIRAVAADHLCGLGAEIRYDTSYLPCSIRLHAAIHVGPDGLGQSGLECEYVTLGYRLFANRRDRQYAGPVPS